MHPPGSATGSSTVLEVDGVYDLSIIKVKVSYLNLMGAFVSHYRTTSCKNTVPRTLFTGRCPFDSFHDSDINNNCENNIESCLRFIDEMIRKKSENIISLYRYTH